MNINDGYQTDCQVGKFTLQTCLQLKHTTNLGLQNDKSVLPKLECKQCRSSLDGLS